MAGRYFKGNHPTEEFGWIKIGSIEHKEFDFSVFAKEWSNGWRQIKVSSNKKTRNKANYWLSWNGERFANGKDYKAMTEHKDWAVTMLIDVINGAIK